MKNYLSTRVLPRDFAGTKLLDHSRIFGGFQLLLVLENHTCHVLLTALEKDCLSGFGRVRNVDQDFAAEAAGSC